MTDRFLSRNRLVLLFGLIVSGLLATWLFLKPSQDTTQDSGRIGQVERTDIIQRVTISGFVSSHRMMQFVPPYEGYVRKIYVKLGDQVKAGDPVVKITPGADDEAFPLRAPFDGVVVQILRYEGEFVEKIKTDVLVRIDDLSRLYVESNVPELDFAKLEIGQKVGIKANAIVDKGYEGTIIEISQASKSQDRWEQSKVEFPIRIEIDRPDAHLKPGMSVVLDVVTEKVNQALALPHQYVRKLGDQFYVIMADGEQRNIEVGLRNEDYLEVKSGLNENDRVRINHFRKL